MLLIRLPRGGQSFFAAPIKPDGQRRECGFVIVDADAAVAFEIQADLDAAGMKTFTPIKFLTHLEVVPLEAQARAALRCRANAANHRRWHATSGVR